MWRFKNPRFLIEFTGTRNKIKIKKSVKNALREGAKRI